MNAWKVLAALAAALIPAAATAAPPKPLFASDEPIRLTIRGPIAEVADAAPGQWPVRNGSLSLAGPTPETLAIRLSPRGLTRRKKDICQFAPLRVEFAQPPPETSLFRGQRRLKLVTHCRKAESFQQHLLLEYAAYRLYNALTPASYRVRLATIDYLTEDGRPVTSRLGFFIEDIDDVARRNDTVRTPVGVRIGMEQLSAPDAARVATFEYLIGNLDWSARAAPPGEECCHNVKLIGPATRLVPVPYDFDYSGLVDAPYSAPPTNVKVSSVLDRHYRGYCRHNAEVLATARDFLARRAQFHSVLAQVPQLEPRRLRKAIAYLDGFFPAVADDESTSRKLLKTCIN